MERRPTLLRRLGRSSSGTCLPHGSVLQCLNISYYKGLSSTFFFSVLSFTSSSLMGKRQLSMAFLGGSLSLPSLMPSTSTSGLLTIISLVITFFVFPLTLLKIPLVAFVFALFVSSAVTVRPFPPHF